MALFSLLVLINIFRLPLGEADDEPDYIHFAQFILEAGHPPLTPAERAAAGARGGFAPLYYQMVAQIIAPFDLDSLPALRRISDRPQRYIPEDGLGRSRLLHTVEELPPFRGIVLAWYAARLLSLVLGLGILAVTYLWAREIFRHRPDRAELALAIVLFVAFLPRFVINSATLSDDNLTVFWMILFLYLLLRLARQPEAAGLYFLAGMVMGLAFLAKYHGLILSLEALLLFAYLLISRRLAWPAILQRALWFSCGFWLIGGPWLVFILYRFNRIAELGWLPGLAAALGEPLLVGRLHEGLIGQTSPAEGVFSFGEWLGLLYKSFWFEYGFMMLFGQPVLYLMAGLVSALALLGWLIMLIKQRGLRGRLHSFGLSLAIFHLGLFGLILLGRYNVAPTVATPQGRHLFPALPVIGAIFFLGLKQLFPRWSFTMLACAYALFGLIGNLLFVELVVRPAFPYLPVAADPNRFEIAHPYQASLNEAIQLVGYDAPAQVAAGQPLPVTLYWQAKGELVVDYWLNLCLSRPSGEAVSCLPGYLGGANYPTRTWERGDVIADSRRLPLAACLSDGLYYLSLSLSPLDPAQGRVTLMPESALRLDLPEVINLSESPNPSRQTSIWYQGQMPSQPLTLRDVVTVLSYDQPPTHLLNETNPAAPWPATTEPLPVTCPNQQPAWLTSFTADYGVQPGRYRLDLPDGEDNPALVVTTRLRAIEPDRHFSQAINDQLNLQISPIDQTEFYPGQDLRVKATWQTRSLMAAPYLVSIRLLDKDFQVGGEKDVPLGGRYPNLLWAPGEVITETYFVALKSDTPPGRYQLEFSLIEILNKSKEEAETTFRFLPVQLADGEATEHLYPFTVRLLDPAQQRFSPAQKTEFSLGEAIHLVGYTVQVGRDNQIDLALYWQADAAPGGDYTVFTQLIGPDGQVWAQQDNQPQAGRYPTQFWRAADQVVDRYQLQLKPAAPDGTYRLLAGMYDLSSGARLPVVDDAGQTLPDGAMVVAEFGYQQGRLTPVSR